MIPPKLHKDVRRYADLYRIIHSEAATVEQKEKAQQQLDELSKDFHKYDTPTQAQAIKFYDLGSGNSRL